MTLAGITRLCSGNTNGLGIYLFDGPLLLVRPGSPYNDTTFFAYTDTVWRLALLGGVGAERASGLDQFWRPVVVHAKDGNAGLR
uniref:glycogen/starch synthase n=1 Tax=Escherichia coli TaxID=562 RepID=UPI0015921920